MRRQDRPRWQAASCMPDASLRCARALPCPGPRRCRGRQRGRHWREASASVAAACAWRFDGRRAGTQSWQLPGPRSHTTTPTTGTLQARTPKQNGSNGHGPAGSSPTGTSPHPRKKLKVEAPKEGGGASVGAAKSPGQPPAKLPSNPPAKSPSSASSSSAGGGAASPSSPDGGADTTYAKGDYVQVKPQTLKPPPSTPTLDPEPQSRPSTSTRHLFRST